MEDEATVEEIWYWYLTGEWRVPPPKNMLTAIARRKRLYKRLPSDPHCVECGIPMAGMGGTLLRFRGSAPASYSPQFCRACEDIVLKHESGAELELSMLFADVRNSTPLAEASPTKEFKSLISRFYKETSRVLVHLNSMVNHLMGDQVSALFVPRFAGKEHARVAIEAAQEVLKVTGHDRPEGPWIPVGVGVHTGRVYVGAVGSAKGVKEIAVLGNEVNLCARLSSLAAAGEILISQEARLSAGLDPAGLEERTLELKGISRPIGVSVLRVN